MANNFKIYSPDIENGKEIPTKFTCEGEDIAPTIVWSNIPSGTKSLALIMEDPDAPDPEKPKMLWIHWVIFNIPPEINSIKDGQTPAGAKDGINSWGKTGYGGPCPPIGRHRYFFRLYALDKKLEIEKPTAKELRAAMENHILAETVLMGTYKKKK